MGSSGYDWPVTVLHFDKFDSKAEAVTRYFLGLGRPFTVSISEGEAQDA